MTRFISTIAIVILGVVAIGAVAPKIATVLHAVIPVILVLGVVVIGIRVCWWYTRR